MKRYEKFVFESETGITYERFVLEPENGVVFEVLETTKGNLTIRAFVNYANPPIPEGYKHIGGEWNNGFVIKRESDESQFVWIPVGSIHSNGTLDGEHFSEKFGRRPFNKGFFHLYNEVLNDELLEQIESVNKYGGFYISRFNISKSSAGKPQSVAFVMPWVDINFYDAKKIASTIEDNETVKSHLTFGAEYDSVLEWFITSGVKTFDEIAKDSTEWGNYYHSLYCPRKVKITAVSYNCCANNIYDLAGNLGEWTQEQYADDEKRVIRGYYSYVAFRQKEDCDHHDHHTGFRAALCIK